MTASPTERPTGVTLPQTAASHTRVPRADVALAAVAFLVVVLITWRATGMIDPRLLGNETVDVWFEADIARVVDSMSERWSNHYRAKVHPIFSLFLLPIVVLLQKVLSLDAWMAIRLVMSLAAGMWVAGLYSVLRLMGCRRPDAAVFAGLGVTSAGAMFWFTVPETHTVASLTIVLALLVVAVSAIRKVPALAEVAVGAATLGITVTNWMAGILASWSHRSWRQALQISANAFALTVVLWAVGKKLTPSAPFFLGHEAESGHILAPEALGPVRVMASFLMHSVVMPAIAIVDRPGAGEWPILTVQSSSPGSAGAIGLVSAVLWGVLLIIGIWSLWRVREHRAMRLFLATFLAGQMALHLLYGNETFLYAPNFLPAFITMAALGALSPWRRAVVPIALLLTVTNAVNNGAQWRRASSFLSDYAQYRHDPNAARADRPDDPWPDTRVFSRLSMPGTRNFDAGFVSAGGSFSPAIDQFTISIWVLDANGTILSNSDAVQPSLPDTDDGKAASRDPEGLASTAFYDVYWQPDGPRRYRMQLTTRDAARVSLVVRGIGARAAPLRHIAWDGARLTINRRWVIEADSTVIVAHLVDENSAGWQFAASTAREITVPNGWAAARLELAVPGRHALVVRDLTPLASVDRPLGVIPRRDQSVDRP